MTQKSIPLFFYLLLCINLHATSLYHDNFDQDGLNENLNNGGASISRSIQSSKWIDNGNLSYQTTGNSDSQRALFYSKESFQSDTGFRMSIRYYTDSLDFGDSNGLSFGLIASDNDLSRYNAFDPFRDNDSGLYAIGLCLTAGKDASSQGMNFNDGSRTWTLDQSGTRVQFKARQASTVTIEIEKGGYWCYRIDGTYEASGVLPQGIDLSKSYHVAIYGQGSAGGRKILQFIKLDAGYAQGERAESARGTWSGGMGLDKIQDLKTMDTVQVRFTDGAVLSASHWAPNKLLEYLWGGDVDEKGNPINICAPRWGDLSSDEPENDSVREKMQAIKAAGFRVKAYSNCQNFNGKNSKEYEVIAQRWKHFCDTNPTAVAFVKSQPYHTGIWDRKLQRYVDASQKFPNRKYMFCYAEYVLKDYALRYGHMIDEWIFDSASDINSAGDNPKSDLVEEQRIYQAFAKAVHAGNPEIAIAFNNGRSTVKSPHFPFADPTLYDDFTFGHSFGGNNNHADKNSGTFKRNYLHIERIVKNNGFVFAGGTRTTDDKIVGNLHSKLSTTGWKSGPRQAWEQADFLQWNLEALKAGGMMTWDGSATSKKQRNWVLRPWCAELLKALDDYLAINQYPGNPNWARAYTILPNAIIGMPYKHVLQVGEDLWDPEGDPITSITKSAEAPAWLNIQAEDRNTGRWVLSGIPTRSLEKTLRFSLIATDSNSKSGIREVTIELVNASN
jgi:hypothetical protein